MRGRAFTLLALRRRRGRGGRPVIHLVSLMDIFTILVFFLLVNAGEVTNLPGGSDVRLPPASAESPPRDGPALVVDGRRVRLAGRALAQVDPARPQALVAPLSEALRPLAGGGEITVLGDRGVPYAVIQAVLEACARAGFRDVLLAVEQGGGHG